MRKLAAASTLLLSLTLAAQSPTPTYIKAGHLFDSESGAYRNNVVLVLSGDRIPEPLAVQAGVPDVEEGPRAAAQATS